MGKALLVASLLLLPSIAHAAPIGLALRLEKVWREETPCPLYLKCTPVLQDEEWRHDVLASIAADYALGDTDLYLIGRFGHRLDAEQNEGAVGVEYRFRVGGCYETATTKPPANAKRITKKKKPCP